MIAVIDSCTWIDALVHGGVDEEVICKAFDLGMIAACDQLWREVGWVLTHKFHLPVSLVEDNIDFYRLHSLNIQITGEIKGSIDPDDDFILECAVRSKARVIVSNDLKHLVRMEHFEGIPILTPRRYLQSL
jgi:predicted nucleic acid-binding protein